MSQSNQALWFDAVPLLVVAALYLGAAALLARRQGVGPSPASWRFPRGRAGGGVYGIVLAVEREYRRGHLAHVRAAVLLGLPALLVLKSRLDRSLRRPERES